jgi:hypothetical protein
MKKTTNPSAHEAFGRRGFLKIGLFGVCVPALSRVPLGTSRGAAFSPGKDLFVILEWYKPEELVFSA